MSIKAIIEQKDVRMNIHQVSFRTHKKHQSFKGGWGEQKCPILAE